MAHAFMEISIAELEAANDALLHKVSQYLVKPELSEDEQVTLELMNAQQKLAQAYLTLRRTDTQE
jgi:hypothetical protein